MLKFMFWVAIAIIGFIFTVLLFSFWIDMTRERREEKGNTVTFQEMIKKNLDFERWCD